LFDEVGAEKVEARLDLARVCAVNYHEVLVALVDRGIDWKTRRPCWAGWIEIVPMDRALANIVGALRPLTRAAGLSLGDLCCLALAWTGRAVALTDQAWADLDIGVAIEVVG
jgi:PIN domain nuclease of toxin-antitoxin system